MYKLAIIGSGPAGIKAAFESINRGWTNSILFEKDQIGGVCLNNGCIPTKFFVNFLSSVKSVNYAQELIKREQIDFARLVQKRESIIDGIRKATRDFLSSKGVAIVSGQARLTDAHTIMVGQTKYSAEYVLIATGSLSRPLPFLPPEKTFTPESFIQRVTALPQRVLIVGAGPIGIEYACILRHLGCSVTVVEKEPRILPGIDREVSNRLASLMKRDGVTIKVSADVTAEDYSSYDCILSAAGRIPQVSAWDDSLIRTTSTGYVVVNDMSQTNQPHIYACGDCIGKDMYAYTAEREAHRVVSHIAGHAEPGDRLFPHCIFSIPALAAVGIPEEAITDKDQYLIKKMFLMEQSPAHVLADKEGFIKVIVDKKTQSIAGASILSKYAAELIHTFALAVQEKTPVSSIKKLIAVHPTISESLIRVLE